MNSSNYIYLGLAVLLIVTAVLFHKAPTDHAGLRSLAQELGFSLTAIGMVPQEVLKLPYYDTKMVLNIRNLFQGRISDTMVVLYLDWGSGEDPARRFVLCLFNDKWNLPDLKLRSQSRIMRAISQLGESQVDFPDWPEFSKQYWVCGNDISAIRSLLGAEALVFLAAHPGWYMEGRGQGMLIYKDKRVFDKDVMFLRESYQEIRPLCQLFHDAVHSSPSLRNSK